MGLTDPFVQVMELGDFSITYRLGGLLEDANKLLVYRSRLKVAMIDTLHGGGVEIVSPQFTNHRIFQPGDEFISSKETSSQAVTPDAPRAEVVFDKAVAAATTESDQTQLEQVTASLEAKLKDLKKADGTEEIERLEEEIRREEREKDSLSRVIEQRKESEENEEDTLL